MNINSIKKLLINNISFLSSKNYQKKYFLQEKTGKLSVNRYKNILDNIPDDAATFSRIKVGKKGDKLYSQSIITYYSKTGDVIRKSINCSHKPTILRDYKTKSTDIMGYGKSKIKSISTKKYDANNKSFILQSYEEHKTLKQNISGKIKLQINKNTIKDNILSSIVTEYPWTGQKTNPLKQKIIGMKMLLDNGYIKTLDVYSHNINIPKNDDYLPYRMIFEPSIKCLYFTKHLLNKKGLQRLNTLVIPAKNLDPTTAAYFSESNNMIIFNKTATTNNLVHLAAHEVQHAYQCSLIGRLGKNNSLFSIMSKNLFGKIKEPSEIKKALKYYIAAKKYPHIENNGKIVDDINYKNNYLEIDAESEAKRILNEYNSTGLFLGKQFSFGNI